jgi:hypothetical protein
MKVDKETRDRIKEDMRKVMDAFHLYPENCTDSRSLHSIWGFICSERRYDDTHPRFQGRERILPHDPDHDLYPCGTNDDTLQTALAWAMKELLNECKQGDPAGIFI